MSLTFESMEDVRESGSLSPDSGSTAVNEYMVCGLRIRSEMRFPLISAPSDTVPPPHIDFTLQPPGLDVANLFPIESVLGIIRNGAGIPSITVSRVKRGYLLECKNGPKAACFLLSSDLAHIDCFPQEGMSRQDIECWLFGLVLAFVLQKKGVFSLHGAAVQRGGKAVAFLGSNGFGKSTLAFFFLQHAYQLVTDDVLALKEEDGQFKVLPACPSMNLWPNTLSELGDEKVESASPGVRERKSRLPLRNTESVFCDSEPELTKLYLLNPIQSGTDNGIQISDVPSSGAVLELFRHTRAGSVLGMSEQRRLLHTFARLVSMVPVSRLQYPAGFDRLPAVYDAVQKDVAE